MSGKKKQVHFHQHHHHHTQAEILQALTYQNQGKTIRKTAILCGVSESTIKDWNRQYRIRGQDFLKERKRTNTVYPEGTKIAAVKAYLSGEDANEVAVRFGILRVQSIYAWARDERYRGGISVDEQRIAPRTNKPVEAKSRPEGMTKDEELEFPRMENAILKKLAALRSERQQPRKR